MSKWPVILVVRDDTHLDLGEILDSNIAKKGLGKFSLVVQGRYLYFPFFKKKI